MRLLAWKPNPKAGSSPLHTTFSVGLESGLVVHEFGYFKEGTKHRWVSVPTRSFKLQDGSWKRAPILAFATDDIETNFLQQVMRLMDQQLGQPELPSIRQAQRVSPGR
jgi:hypothetical protein